LVKDAYKQESRAEFILVGGSNKECTIYSREGFKLGTVCTQDAWIWCCCAKPDGSAVVKKQMSIHFFLLNIFIYLIRLLVLLVDLLECMMLNLVLYMEYIKIDMHIEII